jgi:hypothetical protein
MFLHTNHEFMNPSESNFSEYEKLKEIEIVDKNGNTNIRKSLFYKYPIEIRHWLSLFPRNYLDLSILRDEKLHQTIAAEFNLLLSKDGVNENDIQRFLKSENNYLLISSLLKKYYDFGHHDAYLFPEFQLGNSYVADYLIIGRNSDGWHFVFVELESPAGSITNTDGNFGTVFRKGFNQIYDWGEWIEKSFHSLRETLNKCKKVGVDLPQDFYELDTMRLNYVVIAGRRSDFKEKTYRLRNKMKRESHMLILHYDNLIDSINEISGAHTY